MPPKPSPSSNPGPTIPCEQCGYSNEPERVYCHNCGSKLDRSLLPKAESKAVEHPEKVRKRVEKMTNPRAGWFWHEVKTLFKVVFFSALLAAAVDFGWPPEDLPDTSKKPDEIRLVSSDMMEALGSPTPARVSFSDADINQYLKQKMNKPQDTMIPGVQLAQAYVACKPGVLHIFEEFSAFGLPTYARIDFKLTVKDGKFTTNIVGAAFGRLSIDPQLMQYAGAQQTVDYPFGTLWTTLQRERKQMDKIQSITVGDGRIDLVSKGAEPGR
ncbi:MAG TPA: zinc ribbon domain-containing protein [Chthoniobacter sp.]|jgi:hypothetical protein